MKRRSPIRKTRAVSPAPLNPGEGRSAGSRDPATPEQAPASNRGVGLHLQISHELGAQFLGFLRPNLLRAHSLLNPTLRHLSLALVNDRTMSRLHEEFMGIPGPTDVLTFELDHDDARGRVTSGEVIVCVPEARRQAKARGSTAERELLLYAVHGMLHLCGFDDRTPSGYRRMHRKEDQILTRLGVGPVFASGASPGRTDRLDRAAKRKG